jgi:hypothetical protein
VGKKRVNKYPIVFRRLALERMSGCTSVSALVDELEILGNLAPLSMFVFYSPFDCGRFCDGRASKVHHFSIAFNKEEPTRTIQIT